MSKKDGWFYSLKPGDEVALFMPSSMGSKYRLTKVAKVEGRGHGRVHLEGGSTFSGPDGRQTKKPGDRGFWTSHIEEVTDEVRAAIATDDARNKLRGYIIAVEDRLRRNPEGFDLKACEAICAAIKANIPKKASE